MKLHRFVAVGLALVPVGLVVTSAVQVAALAGAVAALLALEARRAVPDPGPGVRLADTGASVEPSAGA